MSRNRSHPRPGHCRHRPSGRPAPVVIDAAGEYRQALRAAFVDVLEATPPTDAHDIGWPLRLYSRVATTVPTPELPAEMAERIRLDIIGRGLAAVGAPMLMGPVDRPERFEPDMYAGRRRH